MPRKIRNMGTSTMRFNEGIIVSGSIDTSYASKEGVAIVATGSLEISANATNNQVIRIISNDSQREMVFDSFITSGGGSGTAAKLLGNGSKGLRIDASNMPTNSKFFTIYNGVSEFNFQFFSGTTINTPMTSGQINILIDSNASTLVNRIIAAVNGDSSIGDSVKWVANNTANRPNNITASANGSFTNGITLTSNTTGTSGNSFYLNTNTNTLSVIQNSNQLFTGGSSSGGSSTTTQETIASIFSETDHDLVISGSKEVHIRSGEGKAVMILSGTIGGATSPNPSNFTDTNLFVSGTIGSMGTAVKGTSVFGGDLHVSGAAQINTVTVTKEGKVGIGTTTPAHKLEVGGNMSVGEKIMHRNDTDTFIQFPGAENQINMAAGNINFFKIIKESSTPHITVFNDDGAGIDVHFKAQGGNDLLVLDASDARAGIGTDSPISKLDVRGQITSIKTDDSADIKLYRIASNGDLANDATLGEIHIGGSENGSNFYGGAKIKGASTEAWDPGNAEGTSLSFWTTANTSNVLTKRMEIGNDGAVSIGDVPANEKLTVNGVLSLGQTSAPTHTNNYGKLYVKSSDSKLYFKNGSGTEFNLMANTVPTVDADGDTRIEVEQTTDDDTVRFFAEGNERLKIENSKITADVHEVIIPQNRGIKLVSNTAANTAAFSPLRFYDESGTNIRLALGKGYNSNDYSFLTRDDSTSNYVETLRFDSTNDVIINPRRNSGVDFAVRTSRTGVTNAHFLVDSSDSQTRIVGRGGGTSDSDKYSGPSTSFKNFHNLHTDYYSNSANSVNDYLGSSVLPEDYEAFSVTSDGKKAAIATFFNQYSGRNTNSKVNSSKGVRIITGRVMHQSTIDGVNEKYSVHDGNVWISFEGKTTSDGPSTNIGASNLPAYNFNDEPGVGKLVTLGEITGDNNYGLQMLGITFTGQHDVASKGESIDMGLIVESTGELWMGTGYDCALPYITKSTKPNSKAVFGVTSKSKFKSQRGMMLAEGDLPYVVNSLGEGRIWVTNIGGEIENGDYITTSNIAGYGMLQDDDILHNYTVAKCTQNIDWSSVTDTIDYEGVTYKKYLVACTYHCG